MKGRETVWVWVGLGALVLTFFLPLTFMQSTPLKTGDVYRVRFGEPGEKSPPLKPELKDWWTYAGGEVFPLWRYMQPSFFCAAVPFPITRCCGPTETTTCSPDNVWDDMTPAGQGLEGGYKGRSSGLVTPLSASIAEADYWASRWNVRGRPDAGNGKVMLPPAGDLSRYSSLFNNMREWTKERMLFWRVHVTGVSHRGRVLRGWYHLRVRLDWNRNNASNQYDGSKLKYYVIDRLMISARGRSHSNTGSASYSRRSWNGGIGEFVYDFPACKCKGLTYPNYHDGSTWTAKCNEWNPCSYDRYPDKDHNNKTYGRTKGSRCPKKTMGYFTPPCGAVAPWESNYGNNFMYRRAKYPAYSGTGGEKADDLDYGPEQMDEIHVNFKLDQSFCNTYYDLDFVVDGVVIDARNIAQEVVPLFHDAAKSKDEANVDEYERKPSAKDWNYGTLIRSTDNTPTSKCRDSVACVFAVERTISTRFVFTNEEITPLDGAEKVSASMPTFIESADPLPTLLPSEELDCNVELKGIYDGKTTDRKPISGQNFYGAIKYVYSSAGTVDDVWEKRGHTLSYYDVQIRYSSDGTKERAETVSGQRYLTEIKELDVNGDQNMTFHIVYDMTLKGDYRTVVSETGSDRKVLERPRTCSNCIPGVNTGCPNSYNQNPNPDAGYQYAAVTGRTYALNPNYWGRAAPCGKAPEQTTPFVCEHSVHNVTTKTLFEPALMMTLRYAYSRTGQLAQGANINFNYPMQGHPGALKGYQTIWYHKYLYFLNKNNHQVGKGKRITKRCRIKKLLKKYQCRNIVARPWTPTTTAGAGGSKRPKVTQRVRNNVQRKRDKLNTTIRLERGMLIKNPGAWFIYDSRVMHGVHMSILTFFFMPVSAYFARFFKETFMESRIFTHHVWYWAHLVLVWMSAASYMIGLWRQRESRQVLGVNMGMVASMHRLIGWNSTLVMLFTIVFGGIRCMNRTYRKFAAYFHAVSAHVLHYSNLVCVLLSIWIPGSPSAFFDRSWYLMEREAWYLLFAEPIFQCVLVWMIFDIVMHAVMTYLQKKTDEMLELDKYLPKPRYLQPVMFPVLDENFTYDVPGRRKRIICLVIYVIGAGTMATFTWICIHAFSSQNRGLGYMSCTHNTSGKILFVGTEPPPYYTKFPDNCESPWITPLI